MHRLLLAALLVPAILLFACGGADSEESKVESVLRDYVERYIDSEPAEMYALLDSASHAQCSEESYIGFISAAREALGEREFEITEIRDVVIDGASASASATVISTVDGEQADPTENTLVKEDGNWRLELPSGSC
jgi:hypothetical protein